MVPSEISAGLGLEPFRASETKLSSSVFHQKLLIYVIFKKWPV